MVVLMMDTMTMIKMKKIFGPTFSHIIVMWIVIMIMIRKRNNLGGILLHTIVMIVVVHIMVRKGNVCGCAAERMSKCTEHFPKNLNFHP